MDPQASITASHLERILFDENAEPKPLPFSLLERITNGFSYKMKVGRGGSAVVYKAILEKGVVAVRRLSNTYMFENEFHREVECLMKVKHRNIVRFLGYCADTQVNMTMYGTSKKNMTMYGGKYVMADIQQRLLCFEYLQNGALDRYIEDPSCGLEWTERYNIIKGICDGLHYLHQINIVHLDLKPASILLDEYMKPKITEFGNSRSFDKGETIFIDSPFPGTMGYMAPEFVSNRVTEKYDLFSLGVIILEILTGQKKLPKVKKVLKSWSHRLNMSRRKEECEQIRVCVEIGTECMDFDPASRPDMKHIIERLAEVEITEFSQDEPEETTIPSKSSIHEPSSGHAEASRSTHSKSYLSTTEPIAMTLQELHRITDGFSEERLLGKGGFGMVYKGLLDNGEVIAVKKLHNKPGLVEEQFKNELLNLMTIKHQNIIRLVGYCSEAKQIVDEHEGKKHLFYREERALCLEYLQGGNLEELLSDESCELDWEECYRIIEGVCQGIKHLHTGSEDPIYHLDLKPANILLDRNRIPKIGDFGLSRLLASTETFVTKTYSGTTGYMPPEYMHRRQISSKFDVFSLGVIMIEIIAGLEGYYNYKCVMSPHEFINHVTENWSLRVQANTMSTEELLELERCIKLALRCVEDNQAKRPTITEIVEELNMISQYALFDADARDETTLAALTI